MDSFRIENNGIGGLVPPHTTEKIKRLSVR